MVTFLLLLLLLSAVSAFHLPLPGGRSISYSPETGALWIQLSESMTPACPPAATWPLPDVLASNRTPRHRHARGGAFCHKPLDSNAFLGWYKGTVVQGQEQLDKIIQQRQATSGGGDYVLSLDRGVTFLDGYETSERQKLL
jgi:hypothetical protein